MLKRFFQLMAAFRDRLSPSVSPRPKWRIVIPTRDGAARLRITIKAYKAIGVAPVFAVDARSTDDTVELLEAEGCQYSACDAGGGDFVEGGMLKAASNLADTDWVLRLDDDEFPSLALLRFMDTLENRVEAAFYTPRRECFLFDEQIYYSRAAFRYWNPRLPDYVNPQLRIYKRSATSYENVLHSWGVSVSGAVGYAPPDAFHIHLCALFLGIEERVRKIKSYENISKGGGWIHADEYLPEMVDFDAQAASQDGLEEFRDLFAAIPARGSDYQFSTTDIAGISSAMKRKLELYCEIRDLDPLEESEKAACMRIGEVAIQFIPRPSGSDSSD